MELLSYLPEEALDPSSRDIQTEPRNAYGFVQRRKHTEGPDVSVRMSNFAILDMSPPVRGGPHGTFPSGKFFMNQGDLLQVAGFYLHFSTH